MNGEILLASGVFAAVALICFGLVLAWRADWRGEG